MYVEFHLDVHTYSLLFLCSKNLCQVPVLEINLLNVAYLPASTCSFHCTEAFNNVNCKFMKCNTNGNRGPSEITTLLMKILTVALVSIGIPLSICYLGYSLLLYMGGGGV